MNSGFSSTLVVKAEASFAGSLTGTAYNIPGKVAFQYEPNFGSVAERVGVWRQKAMRRPSARFWSMTLDLEYAHTESIALLLSSLLYRSGTTPNYGFNQAFLAAQRQSLAIGLSYEDGTDYVFRGCFVESMQLAVRPREIIRLRLGLVAAKQTEDGPIAGATTEEYSKVSGLHGSASYNGVALDEATEAAITIVDRVRFAQYGDDGVPTRWQPGGAFGATIELAEWLDDVEKIAADVRDGVESESQIAFDFGGGTGIVIDAPRILATAGTPPAFGQGGIGYRATADVLQDRAPAFAMNFVLP